MAVHSYEELRQHLGHKIVCVGYDFTDRGKGQSGAYPFVEVAIECETCNEVLMSFDRNEQEVGDETV